MAKPKIPKVWEYKFVCSKPERPAALEIWLDNGQIVTVNPISKIITHFPVMSPPEDVIGFEYKDGLIILRLRNDDGVEIEPHIIGQTGDKDSAEAWIGLANSYYPQQLAMDYVPSDQPQS